MLLKWCLRKALASLSLIFYLYIVYTRMWKDDSVIKNAYWSSRGLEFCSQHPELAAHNNLWLQFQGVWHLLLATLGTCMHVGHIQASKHVHIHTKIIFFKKREKMILKTFYSTELLWEQEKNVRVASNGTSLNLGRLRPASPPPPKQETQWQRWKISWAKAIFLNSTSTSYLSAFNRSHLLPLNSCPKPIPPGQDLICCTFWEALTKHPACLLHSFLGSTQDNLPPFISSGANETQ